MVRRRNFSHILTATIDDLSKFTTNNHSHPRYGLKHDWQHCTCFFSTKTPLTAEYKSSLHNVNAIFDVVHALDYIKILSHFPLHALVSNSYKLSKVIKNV